MLLNLGRRLALAHASVVVVALLAVASGAHWGLSRAVNGQLDGALLALAETEAAMLAQAPGRPARVHEAAPDAAPPSLIRLDRLVQVVDARGAVLARSANLGAASLPAPAALMARLAAGETVFQTLDQFAEEPLRMVSLPVSVRGERRAVQVAGSLDDVNHVLASASVLFIGMGLALLVALSAAGAAITRRVLRAIDDIVRKAHRIGETNLNERLPHPGTRDEIGGLVDTLNAMLERIEHSFQIQRRFTADASHELRSPLSRLRSEIEITLRRPRDTPEYVEALRSCMEEVERLTLLVEELLALARFDTGQEHGPPETVLLNGIAELAVLRLRGAAAARGIGLALEPAPAVGACIGAGAATLILANLLDNAVKFTPAGGRIGVRVYAEDGDACLCVADSGPGIGVDELPHLFERFYRGATARASGVPGVGLGLSLTQTIAHGRGGRIEAANLPAGGAAFTVRLPLAR